MTTTRKTSNLVPGARVVRNDGPLGPAAGAKQRRGTVEGTVLRVRHSGAHKRATVAWDSGATGTVPASCLTVVGA